MSRSITVLALILVLVLGLVMASSYPAMAKPEFQGGGTIYYVTWGDTLSDIAFRHGVTVNEILVYNGLANPDMVYVGQRLMIPGSGYGQPAYGACATYHTVQMGETLSEIAWRYNTTVQQLTQASNLYNKDFLYAGQKICISTDKPAAQPGGYMPEQAGYGEYSGPATSYHHHTVASGETLSGIAYHYGVTHWTIVQANNLSNAAYIWPGQKLVIPAGYPAKPHGDKPKAPAYDDAYDDKYKHPPYEEDDGEGYHDYHDKDYDDMYEETPPAPDYEASPSNPLLPRADYPVTVVVNGGETWADDVYVQPDPDGITTLIVQTGEDYGKLVRIRSGDSEIKGESDQVYVGEFGPFRFVVRHIPPGDYDVLIDDPDTPSEVARVVVGAGERVDVTFSKQVRFQGQTFASPDGWVLSGWDNASKPGQRLGAWSNILVRTPASGLWVIIEAEGGYHAKCLTGSKGPGACDFAGLSAGLYNIWIDGTDLTLKTYMDGNTYATFDFNRQP